MIRIYNFINLPLITIFLSTCISVSREYRVAPDRFEWDTQLSVKRQNESFQLTFLPLKNQEEIRNYLYVKKMDEQERFALVYLLDNYDIYLTEIINKTDEQREFSLNRFRFPGDICTNGFASVKSLPKEINGINPKGIQKNMVTLAGLTLIVAIVAVTPFVIPDVPYRSSENKDLKKESETESIWFPTFLDVKYKYENLVEDRYFLPAKGSKKGIVFMQRDISGKCKTGVMIKAW